MRSGYPPSGRVPTDKSTHPDSLICIFNVPTQTGSRICSLKRGAARTGWHSCTRGVLTSLLRSRHTTVTSRVKRLAMNLSPDSGRRDTDASFPEGDRLLQVFDAVGAVGWPALGFRAEAGGNFFATRMLASVLVHAYSRGRFVSEEIEEACRNEDDFWYLCSGDAPDARVLRRFRRIHAAALIESLSRLWATPTSSQPETPKQSCNLGRARRCLEAAIAADSLALDF